MNAMKRYLMLAALSAMLFLMAGCTDRQRPEAVFAGFDTDCETVGLYFPGAFESFAVDYGIQVCINHERLTFRLQNSDQSEFVHAEFSSAPSEVSEKVTVSVTSLGFDLAKGNFEMEVVKADGERVWLASETVNMIIPAL